MSPITVLRILSENEKLIEMEAKELTELKGSNFREHRWRVIWTFEGLKGKLKVGTQFSYVAKLLVHETTQNPNSLCLCSIVQVLVKPRGKSWLPKLELWTSLTKSKSNFRNC
jgi:hypothetical protein